MNFEFEHLGETTPLELPEGRHRLGGGEEDSIRLEGLPAGLLTLHIEDSRLMVECQHTFTVNSVWVPPGVPRLVLPGEVLGLPEAMQLRVLADAGSGERGLGTMAVLKQLFTDTEALAPSRAATLTCLTGADVGRTFALAEAHHDIGRGAEVSVKLRDLAVSRRHARILQHEGTWLVEDLGSPNGVYLNGRRVEEPAPLSEGDVLEVGRSLLRFQAAVEEPAPPPPPETDSEAASSEGEASAHGAEAPSEAMESAPAEAEAYQEAPSRRRLWSEWWLIGLGAGAALLGLLALYAIAG